MTNHYSLLRSLACGFVILFGTGLLMAFEDPSQTRPDKGKFDPQEMPPAPRFIVPDVPGSLKDQFAIKSSAFTLKLGMVSILDFTAFGQDEANVGQVGNMEDEFEVRAMRLIMRGGIGAEQKLKYFFAAEFEGFDPDHTNHFTVIDAYLAYPVLTPATRLQIGKFKETFSYEMVGDAANLAQQERVLSPFFVSRNVGVKLTHVGPDERMTFAVGAFNQSWVSSSWDGEATDYSARITGVLGDPRSADYLHFGAAVRRVGGADDTLRFRGKPETNVGTDFVDTGSFAGDHATNYGLEALWSRGPVSLLAEQAWSSVDSDSEGDPVLWGGYLTASWFLTGDHRPYDPTVGYARRVQPQHSWGALELVARFAHVDLQDSGLEGGEMDRVYVGLNWWATQRWKIGVGWGHTWLDRDGAEGESDSVLTRLQWVF